jgi:hypothetical protein
MESDCSDEKELAGTATPKVFISYSWVVKDRVLELAERLIVDGVDVVIDVWDLDEGRDKYAFMEQAVNNPDITRVLVVCDETYAKKANDRSGGVGDETIIISPEVYGNVEQKKFIPVVLETDENDKPFTPVYIKTRIYINLSNETIYETEYEKLLRNIYDKPAHRKPKLGNQPEWLKEENISLSGVRDLLKQLKVHQGNNSSKANYIIRRAIDEFSQALKPFASLNESPNKDSLLKQIDATKPLRDYFLDYLETLIRKDMLSGEIVSDFFQDFFNNVLDINLDSYYPDNLEVYYFFVWESFICTIAILLHYEKYKEIYEILSRTYFLNYNGNGETACTFIEFRQYLRYIEERIKPNMESRLITLAGDIFIKREKKPIVTKENIANADLLLYQLSYAFDFCDEKWYPSLYHYCKSYQLQTFWTRLQSKRYCEKLFPLFGVTSLEKLKKMIAKCIPDNKYYSYGYRWPAPNILNNIALDKIGVLN